MAMRQFTPAEFQQRWPGSLHPIVLPDPSPVLPDDCKRALTDFGLPRKVTISCYNDLTLTFSGIATPLAIIWKKDLARGCKLGNMPADWCRFWHLADQDYLQGRGWVCIEQKTGRLVVIDLDLDSEPVYLLNANVDNFFTTLAYFLEWSDRTGGTPKETKALRDALLEQNCIPSEELGPFWMNIICANLDGDPIDLRFAVSGPDSR